MQDSQDEPQGRDLYMVVAKFASQTISRLESQSFFRLPSFIFLSS